MGNVTLDILALTPAVPSPSSSAAPELCCAHRGSERQRRRGAEGNAATKNRVRCGRRSHTVGVDPIADILAHGYAYATVFYTEIQPDKANTFTQGVIGLTLKPGQTAPAPNEWGTISAWAWGTSRIVDYIETDPSRSMPNVSPSWATRAWAKPSSGPAPKSLASPWFLPVVPAKMGTSLARRDFGETVDDMTQNFPWQFAGNLQNYAGKWNNMPVDTHFLISLSAPRPVFITGGSKDLWSDPKGEFLGAVAAGPVYKLLGKQPLNTTDLPPLDTPLITGDLGCVLSHRPARRHAGRLESLPRILHQIFQSPTTQMIKKGDTFANASKNTKVPRHQETIKI